MTRKRKISGKSSRHARQRHRHREAESAVGQVRGHPEGRRPLEIRASRTRRKRRLRRSARPRAEIQHLHQHQAKTSPTGSMPITASKSFISPLLEAYSNPGEKQDEFKARVTQTAREKRDAAIEELREKTAKGDQIPRSQGRQSRAQGRNAKAQASSATLSTVVSDRQQHPGCVLRPQSGPASSKGKHHQQRQPRHAKESLGGRKPPKPSSKPSRPTWPNSNSRLADDTQKIRDQYDPAALTLEPSSSRP
jgi:hypothetical protein